MNPQSRTHVAVGVVTNQQGEVLITKRPAHVHQGGLWEFPGGKIEPDETVYVALQRELHEELQINIQAAQPLIRIPYDYPDKQVLLDVWRVSAFTGEATPVQGQPMQWVAPDALSGFEFPAANKPIVTAVQLPDEYLITGKFTDSDDFAGRLEGSLRKGIRLVQLRAQDGSDEDYRRLMKEALRLCHQHDALLVLNAPPELAASLGADGVHLTSPRLMACKDRPLGKERWVTASIHNVEELAHAQQIGVDFVVASPVLPTASHPGAVTLGWEGFKQLTEQAFCPVYALGGMTGEHLALAKSHGGQGIAAISAFWKI